MSMDRPGADEHGRRDGVFDYISPSRLNLWLKCPLAFRFKYVDRIESPTSPSLFLGKRVHDGLAIWYRHRQLGLSPQPNDVAEKMLGSWEEAVEDDNMSFSTVSDETALKQQASGLVTTYLKYVKDNEPPPLAVETSLETPLVDPFSHEHLGISLLGIVDLVLRDERGLVIVDFKTAARRGRPAEVSHEIQLGCYAFLYRNLASEREAGLEIRSLVKTKKPRIEFHSYPARRQTHFRRLFAVIRSYLDDLHAGRFVFRPGLACTMCNHRDDRCRAWCG